MHHINPNLVEHPPPWVRRYRTRPTRPHPRPSPVRLAVAKSRLGGPRAEAQPFRVVARDRGKMIGGSKVSAEIAQCDLL